METLITGALIFIVAIVSAVCGWAIGNRNRNS